MVKASLRLSLLAIGVMASAGASGQPIGTIDEPQPGQHVSGVVRVAGWVLDTNPVDHVTLFVDGDSIPTTVAPLNFPRPDVFVVFPSYANSATPLPGYFTSFYTRTLSNGPHSLAIKVTESSGAQFTLGTVSVIVDNAINQPPFGYLDTPADPTDVASGPYSISGWALDDQGVDHIDFLVDGSVVSQAIGRIGDVRIHPQTGIYGFERPDVAAAYPEVPFSLFSGFATYLDSTRFLNGMHTVSVRATDSFGASTTLGVRLIQFENNGSNLAPFGRIEYPLDKASLNCQPSLIVSPPPDVCPSPCFPPGPGPTNPALPVAFFSNLVRGWTLDTGARLDKGQVAYVELLLDGAPIINTRRDCVQLGSALLNCYGVNRPDVARFFSGFVNADNAGFNFAFALEQEPATGLLRVRIPYAAGGSITTGFTNSGKHTLALRVGDDEQTVVELSAMSVDVLCDLSTPNPDRPSFGDIDIPSEAEFVTGTIVITGWADDFDGGISRLDVDIDGQVVATLDASSGTYGFERDDVVAKDIRVASPFVGFAYPIDTRILSDTPHDLVIYAYDASGRRTEIGRRIFVVLNNSPIKR